MKKIILALLLIVSLLLSATACGNGQGNQNLGTNNAEKPRYEIPNGGYDNSKVTITFSHTMNKGLRDTLDLYIEEFNEIYPNIKVEHAQIGGYDELREQIKTEISGNNQPNIAYCYPDHVALYNISKKVIPLDAFIESQEPAKNFDGTDGILGYTEAEKQDLIDGGYYYEGTVFDAAGTMYTLPILKSTEVLYYNVEFFEENDLEVPTTWEEMAEVCRRIKELKPQSKPLGYDSESNLFITMCEQYGSNYTSPDKAQHYIFNNNKNKEFVAMFREWYQNGWITTKELSGGYTSSLFTQTKEDGKAYMCIGSSGGAKNQLPEAQDGVAPFTVGVAAIPQVDVDNPKVISQGPSLCIFESDNPQEVIASWLFVKFLTTNAEYQTEVAKGQGYMPVIASARESQDFKDYLATANGTTLLGLTAGAVKAGVEMKTGYFVSPAFNGSSKARDQVGIIMQTCLAQEPGATADRVKAIINKAFNDAFYACTH